MKIRDLSTWEAFYWVARECSFTAASRRLKVGPPLLSKRVAQLEESLGVRLLQRTTRKVSLTQEGRAMMPQVESLLDDFTRLETQFETQSEVAGLIRMTCVTAFAHRVLAPLLAEFCRIHPKVKFELDPTDALLDLIDHQLDLAIRVQEPAGADFVFRRLLRNDLVLCASPSYLKGSREIRSPRDLRQHRILMLKVYESCRFHGSTIRLGDLTEAQAIFCENGMMLTELASQGAGIAVRSIWDVEPLLKSGKLKQVLPHHPLEPYGTMYAVVPNRRLVSHRVRVFLDFLLERTQHWRK